jgi:hypothetical protein
VYDTPRYNCLLIIPQGSRLVTDIGIQPTIFTTGELDGVLKMAGEEYEALEV